jgi:hypothetical protein
MNNSEFPQAKNPKKASAFALQRRCPACKNPSIRRTGRQGWLEKLLSIVNLYPFRCTNFECNHRFMRMSKN